MRSTIVVLLGILRSVKGWDFSSVFKGPEIFVVLKVLLAGPKFNIFNVFFKHSAEPFHKITCCKSWVELINSKPNLLHKSVPNQCY